MKLSALNICREYAKKTFKLNLVLVVALVLKSKALYYQRSFIFLLVFPFLGERKAGRRRGIYSNYS